MNLLGCLLIFLQECLPCFGQKGASDMHDLEGLHNTLEKQENNHLL